jgi:hypothetical protein
MIQPIRACQTLHKTGKKTLDSNRGGNQGCQKAAAALRHPTTARKVERRGSGTLGQQKEGSGSHRQHKEGKRHTSELREREAAHLDNRRRAAAHLKTEGEGNGTLRQQKEGSTTPLLRKHTRT